MSPKFNIATVLSIGFMGDRTDNYASVYMY